jgi:DeoR family transcriptional regulator, deoxyribose operon repressor
VSKRDERLGNILTELGQTGAASVKSLAAQFDVTEVTMRRDLNRLLGEGKIRLIQGVAVPLRDGCAEAEDQYSFESEASHNQREKQRIAREAVSLLQRDDTVIFDAGSTTGEIAKELPHELPLTILTNALNIVNTLAAGTNWDLIVPGGFFHKDEMLFASELGTEMISAMRANKAFIAASGVYRKLGVTCKNMFEVGSKRAQINSSVQSILAIDSSKFGSVQVVHFAEIEEFDIVITDAGIPDDYREFFIDKGIDLHVV